MVAFVGVLAGEAIGFLKLAQDAEIADQFMKLLAASSWLDRITGFFGRYGVTVTPQDITNGLAALGKFVGKFLLDQASTVTGNVLAFVVNFFFMLLITYFCFLDSPKLVQFIKDLSPLPDDQDQIILNKFKDMAGAILYGNGLAGLIQGVLGGGLFAAFAIPQPVLWGVIMGILAFLPIVGIGSVLVPAAIILFLQGRFVTAIIFLVFYVLVAPTVESILKPKFVGDRVKMHPLLVFLSILGGLRFFGILGVIYGPLVMTTFITLADIYQTSYRSCLDAAPAAENADAKALPAPPV
jgi:predicted PurR-regulated permease PerM